MAFIQAAIASSLFSAVCFLPLASGGLDGRPREHLVVVVLSGFSNSQFGAEQSPHLFSAAGQGATSAVRSVFPTESFPTQYSLLTGLRPNEHGVVWNNMLDVGTERGRIVSASSPTPDMLLSGELIWDAAREDHVRTALFSSGQKKVDGFLDAPCKDCNPDTLVDKMLTWVSGSVKQNISAGSLSFLSLRPELETQFDRIAEKLLKKLEQLGLQQTVNVILTGDYGLVPKTAREPVCLSRVLHGVDYVAVDYSGGAVSLRPGVNETLFGLLGPLAATDGIKTMEPNDFGREYNHGSKRRVAPMTVIAEDGYVIADKDCANPTPCPLSRSGYSSTEALTTRFVGTGPRFAKVSSNAAALNITDLHSLMCAILKLKSRSCSRPVTMAVQRFLAAEMQKSGNEHVADESNIAPAAPTHRTVSGFGVFVIILSGVVFIGSLFWMKNYFAERRRQGSGYRLVKNAFEPDLSLRSEPLLGDGDDSLFRGESLQLSVMPEGSRSHMISSDDDEPPDTFSV